MKTLKLFASSIAIGSFLLLNTVFAYQDITKLLAIAEQTINKPVAVDIDPAYSGTEVLVAGGFPNVADTSYYGKLYAWRYDGTAVPGWPKMVGNFTVAAPVVADIDGDGSKEVVAKAYSYIYVWHTDTSKGYTYACRNAQNVAVGNSTNVKTGWPKNITSTLTNPVVGDIDPAYPGLEIMVIDGLTAGTLKIYAWHHDGTAVTGWTPKTLSGVSIGFTSTLGPTIADINSDGKQEILLGTNSGKVYAWNGDGTNVSGWPVTVGTLYFNLHPVAADIDSAYAGLEIIAGSYNVSATTGQIYAWHKDGTAVSGWPVSADNGRCEFDPVFVCDMDNDGAPEILAAPITANKVYAWEINGTPVTGWPKAMSNQCRDIAVGDFYLDGKLEVLSRLTDNNTFSHIYAWYSDGTQIPSSDWPITDGFLVYPSVYDLNADGVPELITAESLAKRVHIKSCLNYKINGYVNRYGITGPSAGVNGLNVKIKQGQTVVSIVPTVNDPQTGDPGYYEEIRVPGGTYTIEAQNP